MAMSHININTSSAEETSARTGELGGESKAAKSCQSSGELSGATINIGDHGLGESQTYNGTRAPDCRVIVADSEGSNMAANLLSV